MSELSESIDRLFAAESTSHQVRAIEAGASWSPLWQRIAETGFQDALVPESVGGVGLGLSDIFDVLLSSGAHCVPVPLAMTMVARAVLAEADQPLPDGPITLATAVSVRGDTLVCERVASALTSQWVLICRSDTCALAPVERAELIRNGVHGSLECDLVFPASLIATSWFSSRFDGRTTSASLVAAQMAGAMERVLTDTVRFANERSQFGKPIGQFQAIQQQISGMAEQVFSARMAAQLGCISTNHHPNLLRSAVAKARASEAAVTVAAVAHAVHGAMGITEEYDLQLFTRRLHEWRLAVGSETYWNRKIGQSIMRSSLGSSVDFIREQLSAEAL